MKHIFKKAIAILLAILCTLNLTVVSFAEETVVTGTCGENVSWSFDEGTGTLTINGEGAMYDFDGPLNMPWNEHRASIKMLIIGNGVTSIGSFAFNSCEKLISVEIPESITKINGHAFAYCDSLASVSIPNSVTSIGDYAFISCDKLVNVTIGNSVISIGTFAFDYCLSLKTIAIPDSVTSIGDYAFSSCTNLISVDVSDGVTRISSHMFSFCTKLENIVIPDSVTNIGDYAFYECDSITSVTIPDSTTIVEDWAFNQCDSITSVTIGGSVAKIGDCAFARCPKLTTTYYPGTEEQWNAITIGADNEDLTKNIVFDYKETMTGTCGENATWSFDEVSGKLTISGYGEMNDYAINNNSIPYYYPVPWVDYKPYVKSIEISSGITYIGMNTFRDCTEVTELVIPEGVSKIGTSALGGCKKLYSIEIPESITVVDSSAFLNSQEIKEVYYAGSFEKWNAISFASKESNPLRYEGKLYFNGDLVEDLIIPDGIKEINKNVFSNNSCITSVTIPDSVESIGENAFISSDKLEVTYYTGTEEQWNEIAIASGNDALTRNVVFNYGKPSNICGENATWSFDDTSGTLIITGTGAVSDYSGWSDIASGVAYVEIGNGITSVGENAFNGFSSLEEVYMAESVSELGANAFAGCSKLAIVTALANDLSLENAFSGNDSRLFFVVKAGSGIYTALKSAGFTVNGTSTDKEKDGHKVLAFDGKTTIYQNLGYNYISNLIADNSDAHYLYFDKVTFEGIAPDIIIVDEENLDSAEEYFTLNEVYISVSVNGKTVTLPELVELLQSEDVDGIISFEEKEGETFFEKISDFFEETVGEFVTQAFKVIKNVINAIRRLFR